EKDERHLRGRDGAELGDRHLIVGEDLEQQSLGLHLDAVDLVDEQHDGIVGPDGLEQRAGEEELLGEDVLFHLRPGRPIVLAALDLDAQKLLLVVPLVEGLRLVEPLVALQAAQPAVGAPRHGLGQLGLARAGRALDQDGLLQTVGQVDDAGDALIGQVVDRPQPLAHCGDGLETGLGFRHGHWVRTWPSPWTTYFAVVSSRRPMGPRAWSFWELIPISAPKPNSSPSVKRVAALTVITA